MSAIAWKACVRDADYGLCLLKDDAQAHNYVLLLKQTREVGFRPFFFKEA